MAESFGQYGLAASLPVASPATYLLLVDSRVSNHQDIINAKQPGVYHIVFDAPSRPTHSTKLIKDIEEQIAALGVPAFTSIGLVQHNDGRPIYEMFGRISDRMKPIISDVATRDPDIQTWNRISLFITMLRLNYGIVNFDMMACALYSDPNWKHVIDKLTAITGVTVRASTDDTGAASLGGDWFLESHTGANLKEIYFTEAIENYTGVLYTAPSSQSVSVPPAATTAKKLILIDNRIKDIDVIINSMNEDTYCLVFNYFYDTPASILSKLRFLTGNNRYILDNFHYEPPTLPTRMDASGNHCTPCDDFDTNDIQLVPGILENEYLEYTMSGGDASGNGGVWPFYSESTNITIQKPVFFQRAKIGETVERVVYPSTEVSSVILNYKPRPMVLVSDLDAFYELGQNVGEIGNAPVAFDCVGIIQHTIDPTIGYKFVGGSDDTIANAIVKDVVSRDSSLSSWAPFTAFIQAMKTAHQMTTLDLMACALYANPDWKFVIDTLAVRENITIRASLDNTGSGTSDDEANWVLETDNISLTTVYFTDKIYDWKYVLATYIDSRFNALRWNDSMYATRDYDSRLKIAAGTNSFTIETWYYETTNSNSNVTVVDMGNYNFTFQIRRGGANWVSIYNPYIGWMDANIVLTPGQWNHIAVTRSGSTFTFYQNGTARQVITNSTSFYSNNSTFAIGWQSPDTCQCNRMKLDTVLYDIRLWNVARTATEIQMNRNRIVPANSTGLVANYLCTDNGTTLNDRTANALHTTIQNYNSARWSNNTVTIPNIGFLINNGYSLTTSNTSTALNAFTHFDNITYTDFSGVDLSGVNFRGADLTGCNFTNANLTNTNFANAYLINATTTNAITTGSNIAQAITNLTSTALNFDGVDDAVSAGVPAWTYSTQFRTTMTVECWFKTTDTNNQKPSATLVARYNTGGYASGVQFLLGIRSIGDVTFILTNTSGTWFQVTSPLTYKDMLWHHAVGTYDSATGVSSVYVDGVLVNSGTNASYGLLSNNTTLRLTFGCDDAGLSPVNPDRQFRGQISDIRIWNVVRSAAEIAANYQQRLTGNETGLVGYWKLNHGYGTGWATYSSALDSTSNRAHGTLINMGATPSGSWVVSNINFQPQISTLTLGTKNGVYDSSDFSFSMIDPSSNSLGDFTYSVSPTTVATVVNGAAMTKTIYATSGAISIPTLSLYDFPEIASLSNWQIDVGFTVTGGSGTWRALIGDMYNSVSTIRGWGLWVSANNPSRIHWSWMGTAAEPGTITVSLNTAYVLTAAQSSGTITLTLRTVSSGAIQTGSFSVGANVIGKGPVTIGGWQNYSGENFPGTISYVNVSVPTNQRIVTFYSSTNAGTPATVTATQASLLDYRNGTRTASLTVNKVAPTFSTSFSNVTRTNYQTFTLTLPISNSNGAFSFTNSDTSIATINPVVTINALQFNGTTNFVDFAANIVELGKASFTIECWVKTTGTSMGLLNCQDSDSTWESGEKSLYIDDAGIPVFVGWGCNFIYATVAVNDDIWHHIAVTWLYTGGTSGTPTFYVDGINRTGTTHPFYSIYPQYTANTYNLGTFVFGKPTYGESVNYFNGAVCELRIWNVARSASDIYQNYQRILLGNETGLVAYNRFDQGVASGTNTSITTVSNNLQSGGYTGTLSGDFTLTGSSSNWVSGRSLLPVYDVNILNNGTSTITVAQAETLLYTSQSTTSTLTVSIPSPTINALTIPSKTFGDSAFIVTLPTSNSDGSFSFTSSDTSVAVINNPPNALHFDGVNDSIDVGIPSWTYSTQFRSSMTVECWFKTSDTNNQKVTGTLVARHNTGSYATSSQFIFYIGVSGALSLGLTNTSGTWFQVTSPLTYKDMLWHHAVGTYDSATGVSSVYVDGVLVNSGTNASYGLLSNNTTLRLTIGSDDAGTSPNTQTDRQFRGAISDVRIWNVVRTSTEILNNYAIQLQGNETGLVFYNKLDQGTAGANNSGINTTTNNLVTGGNSGTLVNFSLSGSTSNWVSGPEPIITILSAGSTTITATQAATTNYTGGSSVSASLVVSPIAPTIGALSVPAKNFGDASFSLTAPTSDSDGAFSYTSSDTSVATVTSGGTVTVVGAGSTTITATQAATINYTGGSSVSATLVVSPIAPTIGALSVPAKNFGDASFSLTAPTSDSDGAFSYTSSDTSVATVTSGGTVTVVGAGSTTITATQAVSADGNYTGGSSVTASLVISPIAPTINAWTIPAKNFGEASFSLTAPTSDSNGAFSYTSSDTSVATVTSGGTVTMVGVGSTTITATQAVSADGNYTGGSSVSATLVISPGEPTFETFTIPEKFINDISFSLTPPTSNSNGAFTFSTDASGSEIATVTSGGVVTLTGVAGTATITVTQAASADGNYTSRSVTASLIVNAALSNFTVPSNKVYADADFDLTDPITIYSSDPFIFTSSDTTVASIGGAGGRTVTIHKAGSTTITARQAATSEHSELTITAVLVIAKKTTVITLSTITKNYGDASFNILPSSTNTDDEPPTFTMTSRNADIISIFDVSYAAISGVGSVLIDINQTETTNFTSGSASVSIVVSKGNPVLSTFSVSTGRTYGSAPFSALAYPTSNSNGTIVYSSSDSTVASIDSSGIITLLKAGYVNFVATQQATAYYNSATKVSNTMTVYRQILPLTRSSPTESTINKTYGDGYFNVIATNNSNGGTITYETNNPSVAGIVGSATAGVISVISAGTATITARRGQTDQYTSDPISWTVEVARITTTLTGLSDLSYNVTAAPFAVTASSASDGAVTYSLQDPSSQVLTIHPTSGLVTLRSPGSAVVVASQAQGTNYLAPASITATITVSSAGNALQGATITNTASFAAVNLEGASLAGVSITNTTFTAAKLTNANLTNAVIVSANFASADLSGATLAGATITGATFTAASLKNADLSGAVLTNTAFTGSDLSGAKLTGVDASGASFANAKLNNVDLTGANIANVNFTNTSIKGAIIADVSFSPLQKLQLLKNSENRDIGQIIIPAVTGTTVLAAISETSPLRAIENLDLAAATVAVVVPTTSTSPTDVLPDVVLNVTTSDKFYLPINESEFFQIEGVKYYTTDGVVRNYSTNAIVEVISYNGTPVWLLAGSIVGLVLQTNTLNSSSFVIPSRKLITDTSPFMPTTLPTSNNTETPIVYSSSNPNIATIDASSGEITLTGNFVGFVHFTATQVQNATYEPGTSVSNTMLVDRSVTFTLTGLNQTFNLSTLATLDASSISVDTTDATAVFYVRLSDINNIFMYQSDASDVTNDSVDDIKYYVFHRKWPVELKLNPIHAMMNKTESAGMLGVGDGYTDDKSLTKHDFIRYIALRLFNTIHGVDLFHNEIELNENSVYLGETVRYNIDTILSEISTTSSSETMSYDASGNKYLTNDASGNTNLCREIMRHIAAVAPSRFYGNVPNHAGLKNVPFIENDTLQYKLVVQAAASQNLLTGVSVIPSRSYTIKLVLKNTVNSNTNANTVISDSIMYPNSYPYSSSVVTYLPTSDSSGVYNLYSPPAPIPFARFGYNGWYYTNSTAWVNVASAVRNHIKWLVGGNTETSKIGDLQYIRINLKIHNTASLPYLMIYTQAGSSRKYAVVSGNGSLTNGTVYSFYMNFNSYAREPAYIGHTNAALGYTVGTGSFANDETITSVALESDSNATASNVEFTLSSIIVGELSTTTNLTSEKEYGFEAAVPETYP